MSGSKKIRCLLCDHPELEHSASLTGRDLRSLWNALENKLRESAYGPIAQETQIILYKCSSCGFRFYDPVFAGSGAFYEELMASKIYPLGSLEFDYVISFALKNGITNVLDVGGGEGAFLDRAKLAGLESAGVELNPTASEVASSKGHRMFNIQMEDIPIKALDGGTDLLTLFQVVEHVPSPVAFVKAAIRLIKPGGYLAVAVPSDKRMLGLLENDPADWPPHHSSRWRMKDLRMLGERNDLEIVKQLHNPLFGSALPWAIDLHNKLEITLNRPKLRLPPGFVYTASLIYRCLRLHRILPFHGLAILTIYQKPLS